MSGAAFTPRILSIQSHTVHGFVGNKAAAFPLQTMGYDIDCINTVSLSNHPAYKNSCKGQGLDAKVLTDIVDGLESNNLLEYEIIMSGYTRQITHLESISATVKKVREINPDAIYICDPVLGDNESYYVPSELKDVYSKLLFPLATVITPNIFETQVLSGVTVRSFSDAVTACQALHALGPKIVVLTGIPMVSSADCDDLITAKEGRRYPDAQQLSALLSVAGGSIYRVDVSRIEGALSGCGDLFASLLAPGIHVALQHQDPLEQERGLLFSLGQAATIMTHIVSATTLWVNGVKTSTDNRARREQRLLSHGGPSLRIIEARDHFISYSNILKSIQQSEATNAAHEAYVAQGKISGVIFDMDGTLTMPGAIDYTAIRTSLNIPIGQDIVETINQRSDPQRSEDWKVVEALELEACERQILRPKSMQLVAALRKQGIRTALATRNCGAAVDLFGRMFDVPTDTFYPSIARNFKKDINKPSPVIAEHIQAVWDTLPRQKASVWFVGDSKDDMLCGKGAGCTTILLKTDYNGKLQQDFPGLVDNVVDTIDEIAELMGVKL